MIWPDREQSSVLALLRWALGYVPSSEMEARLQGQLNWTRVIDLAHYHGIAYLLNDAVQRSEAVIVPADARRALNRLAVENTASVMLQESALRRILFDFTEAGLRYAVHKGFGLGALVYDRPELRPAGCDCDILVRRADFPLARKSLEKLGYRLVAPHYQEREIDLVGEVKFVRETVGGDHVVDLHVEFVANPWGKVSRFSAPDFWHDIEKLRYRRMEIPHLPATVYLLFLCLHCSTNHHFDRLILFCDLDFFIRRKGEEVDWIRLVAHAKAHGARKATFFALNYCSQLLGTRIPPRVLEELQPAALFRRLIPARKLMVQDKKPPLLLVKYMHAVLLDHPFDVVRSGAVYLRRKMYRLLRKVT